MVTFLQAAPKTERVGRYPKHPFRVNALPFTAQPFMIAPVLPAETLTNIYMESRVVSDPVLNPIIGWKQEYYFFYVRVSDMLSDLIRDMFVDPTNTDLTATLGVAANDQAYYQAKGGIDYLKRAMIAITTHYFRDQDEAWDKWKTASGLPMVQIRDTLWMDSLVDKDLMPEGPAISSAVDAGDLERLMDAYEMLRSLNVANMTYEDFLRQSGVRIPTKDENKPELLARFAEFSYPANTIDPVSGAPTSALSWVFKNGNRDPKQFKEPGFVIGVAVTRPKVYFSGLAGYAAAYMGRAWDWMPQYLATMPETSMKQFVGDTGPLGDRTTATDSYWADMRDLLLYGDQFHNVQAFNAVPANVGAEHMLALPIGDPFNVKNPTEAMAKSFFKDAVNGTNVKHDGVVSLSIKGHQVDYTKGNFATA